MKAVIYARYSSHNQREESIEGQLRECHEYARKNGLVVIEEYCDRAISGKTDHRPAFQKMIHDSDSHTFDTVIMYTLDRFARNRYDAAIYKARLKKNGVKLCYAKQPLPDTPEGIILESLLEGYAEYYSANLSRNVARGIRENVLKGLAPRGASLGYRINSEKKYEIDPNTAPIVEMMFQRTARGESYTKIVNYLNDSGFRTIRGGKFTVAAMLYILRNKIYIGTLVFKDMEIEDAVEPIIDKKTWDMVQKRLSESHRTKPRERVEIPYILSGKLFCGECGAMMLGDSGTSVTTKRYLYYVCVARKRRHECTKKYERKENLEKLVVSKTVEVFLTDENIDQIAEASIKALDKERDKMPLLKANLRDIENKISNLLKISEYGTIPKSVRERLLELEENKTQVEEQIELEKIKTPLLTKDHIVYWLRSFRNGDIEDIEYQRKIIDTLVNSVYIYDTDHKIVIIFNISGSTASVTLDSSTNMVLRQLIKFYPNFFFYQGMIVFSFTTSC